MRRKWDPQIKTKIVLAGLAGECVTDMCREFDIRPGQYYKWREHFVANAPRLFEPERRNRDMSALEAENERLKRLVGELTLRLEDGEKLR